MSGEAPPAAGLAVREVALAQARTFARAGRYAEAEDLLNQPWEGAERDVAVLDLRARVYAQQGRLHDAELCWRRAAELAPGNGAAADGLRRIAALQASTFSGGFAGLALTSRFTTGGAVVVALLAVVMLAELWPEDARSAPAAAPASSVRPTVSVPPPSPSTGSDVLAELPLDGPGIRVQRLPGEIAITFARGLFGEGATLSQHGRSVLRGLGGRLRPYGDRITIAVIGHTDRSALRPGGEYASNVELGTVRATVVREVLRSAARLPTARFSVSTLADMLPPHSGDDPGDARNRLEDARNRTVSLRISQADGR